MGASVTCGKNGNGAVRATYRVKVSRIKGERRKIEDAAWDGKGSGSWVQHSKDDFVLGTAHHC